MDKEKYQEALKKIKAEKPPENYMVVQLSYDTKLVLPHKAGLALLSSMENAEVLKDSYSDRCKIIPLERDSLSSQFLSTKEYQQIKIANLLNVTLGEVQNIQQEA